MAVVRVAGVARPICVVVSLLLLVFLIIKKIIYRDYFVFHQYTDLFALPYFVGLVLRLFFRQELSLRVRNLAACKHTNDKRKSKEAC